MNSVSTMTSLERSQDLLFALWSALPSVLAGGAIVLATALVARGISLVGRAVASGAGCRSGLSALVAVALSFTIWCTGVIAALVVAVPSFTAIRALLVLLIGLIFFGLVARDVVANFAARLYLLSLEPFELGDTLQLMTIEGVVETIGGFHTILRQESGLEVVIPNSVFWHEPFSIQKKEVSYRVQAVCAVDRVVSIDEVRNEIRNILNDEESVEKASGIEVLTRELLPKGAEFQLSWWTKEYANRSIDSVLEKVSTSLEKPKKRTTRKRKTAKES